MTRSTPLVLAAGQAEAVAGDVVANASTAARLAVAAADRGADVLVLPEAFLTGYDEAVLAGDLPDEAGLLDRIDPVREAARAGGLTVVVGTALRRGGPDGGGAGDGVRRLAQVVVGPDGGAGVPYDKQHLDGAEKQHLTVGDHGATLVVGGLRLGLSICYDGCFPEHARDAAEDGAVGYLCSVAYAPGGADRMALYYAARALDNGMYVVVAGLTGRCGSSRFVGRSAIHDPEGRTLVRLGEEEGLAVADLETDLVAATRDRHTMTVDHRTSLGPRVTVDTGTPSREGQSTGASSSASSARA